MADPGRGRIEDDYPWTRFPLTCSAPMRLISTSELAVEVSIAGGFGFLGAGTDPHHFGPLLDAAGSQLAKVDLPIKNGAKLETLPVGIGIINWAHSSPKIVVDALMGSHYPPPAAVWFFAPKESSHLGEFAAAVREATRNLSKIWIQVGSIQQAIDACVHADPDVLVAQGAEAGGHGLAQSCGIISLLPEVEDAVNNLYGATGQLVSRKRPRIVAAGGIVDGRGAAAALALGAEGIVLGTRYLASPEANILDGYRHEVVRATDGGQTTVRSRVYDRLRGTDGWPKEYNGRGVTNASYDDAMNGMDHHENQKLYQEAIEMGNEGWGPSGRMTTYASTSVGLIREIKSAKQITEDIRQHCIQTIARLSLINTQ